MTPEQIMTVCRASRVASLRVFGDWQCDLKLLPEFQTVLNSVFLQLALDSTVPAGVVVCPLPVPMAPARVVFGLRCAAFWVITVWTARLPYSRHFSHTTHAKPQGPSSLRVTDTET